MKKILFILFIVITFNMFSQNWNLINKDYTYNYFLDSVSFEYNDTVTSSIFVDSVNVIQVDSVFYLNRVYYTYWDTTTNMSALRYNQPSFLQKEVVKMDNKYFFNDTLSFVIFPYSEVGYTWIFDTINNITAEIINKEELNILGAIDSVKYIQLSNNGSIIISKNNGIVYFNSKYNNNIYNLNGIETPTINKAWKPHRYLDYFDFNVGDVFQFSDYYNSTMGWSATDWRIDIIDKEYIGNDTIKYIRHYMSQGTEPPEDFIQTVYYVNIDTFIFNYHNRDIYKTDTLAYCSYSENNEYYVPVKVLKNTVVYGAYNIYGQYHTYTIDTNNTNVMISEWPMCEDVIDVYKVGFGKILHKTNGYEWGGSSALVGYIKNGDTTGTIYTYTNINELYNFDNYKVYPNPVKDIIHIESYNNDIKIVELLNCVGVSIIRKEFINRNEVSLNVSDLPKGIYFIKINNAIKKIIKD